MALVLLGLAPAAQSGGQAPLPAGHSGAGTGAAPPDILSTDQQARLAAVLAPYRPESLTASDARAIQQGLLAAGLPPSRALHAAMARAGFSAKQLEALAPSGSAASAPAPASATASANRRVPRPQ